MDEYIELLGKTSLFSGISGDDIKKLLGCVHARKADYEKNETVLMEGDLISEIGIVLSGSGHSVKIDGSGKSTIITVFEKGGFIGVLLAAGRERKSPVTVQATERLSVLFIPFSRIIRHCGRTCTCHDTLSRNCFDSVAEKSLELLDRIDCLIRPTVREKIMTYLTRLARLNESSTFTISLDRSAMAEYLNADRSALSRELSKMKQDGLIDYYKNSFRIL